MTLTDTRSLLAEKRPECCPRSEEDLEVVAASLAGPYRDYISHVSPNSMAMSLEACTYIWWLAAERQAATAIDFGSGFTSYALRTVCDGVLSVDSSPEWLAWTQRFLERYGLDDDATILMDSYEPTSADLVVYDYSGGDDRDAHFVDAFAAIAPGGVAVLDDAMHAIHQKTMRHTARAFGYELYSLAEWTTDQYRRYCALVVRP